MMLPIALRHPFPRHGILSFMFQRTPTHHHRGVDLVAPAGTPVVAIADGVIEHAVTVSGTPGFRGYGHVIVLHVDGGNMRALYAHLSDVGVVKGQRVTKGEVIGTVGKSEVEHSGAHLHFELAGRAYPMPAEHERIDPAVFF